MKELYNRQANYPIGQPFTTDVMRATIKEVERTSENNRFARIGNMMSAVQWPVSFLGKMLVPGAATYDWGIFKFQILHTGIIDQAHGGTVVIDSAKLKFYPTFTYPSNIETTTGGTPVDTAFATYLVGSGTERSCLVIYPKSATSDYGDLYTRDTVFTFEEDLTLAIGEVVCVPDSDSEEVLPNGNSVYYRWTITYGNGTTATDIHTYLNSGTPTSFTLYFSCAIYDDNTGPVVMPAATSKNIFFMRQGLSVTLPTAATTRFLLGVEYLLNFPFTGTGDHELCVYLKLP